MKKVTLLSVILISIIFFSSSFKKSGVGYYHSSYRSGGPAAASGAGRTGAPFNTSNCSGNGSCHDGGTYAPTFNVELLDNTNTAVTNYTAGANYTLRISIVATDISFGTPQYGFQTTSVKSATNANLNTWGAGLPVGIANVFLSGAGRNYVEHNAPRANGIINIPWTAPAANFGTVRFYTAGNAVDGNSDPSNDSPTGNNVLTIGETILPISLLSFSAKQLNNGINLNWKTAQEVNNDYFLVERSINGIDFSSIGKLKGKGNTNNESSYNFVDKNAIVGKNYYRLAQTDISGKVNYSSIVEVNYNSVKDLVRVSPNPVINEVFVKTNFNKIGSEYSILNSSGIKVLSGIIISDKIEVHNLAKGNYFLKIKQANGNVISCQFVK